MPRPQGIVWVEVSKFPAFMAEKLALMEFQSSMADPDVWLRAATKTDGESYYEYVLMYVDDILSLLCNPRIILEEIQCTFKLKHGKIEGAEYYLGAKRRSAQKIEWTRVLDNFKPRLRQGCSHDRGGRAQEIGKEDADV